MFGKKKKYENVGKKDKLQGGRAWETSPPEYATTLPSKLEAASPKTRRGLVARKTPALTRSKPEA